MNNNIFRKVAIICNPKSGKGKPLVWLQAFIEYLNLHQIPSQTFIESLPNSLNGFTDLVIIGGDGTLNYTLNHLKEIPIPIGILPCGTGNDFAHGLLGKKKQLDYFHDALFAQYKPVDAGICNQKYFLNGVGIGFDGWVVKKLLAKNLFTGKAAYYSTVISLLLFYKESKVKITSPSHQIETDLFMFSAANGKTYGGGFVVAPQASCSDQRLDMLTVKKITLPQRLKYLPVIEKGNHLKKSVPFIHYHQDEAIQITSERPLQAHLDGEWMESTHFDIRILPHYLQIRH